jgi:hypothetical protein
MRLSMRLFGLLLAMVGALFLAATAPAQSPKAKGRDWRASVVMLPSGAYAIGNPAARVKLVEYLSYTCSHCAHFVAESKPKLHDDLVRRGVVRVEFRHAVRDPLDMAAALLARCAGPRGFAGASEAIFAAQPGWYAQGAQWWQANGASLKDQSELARLKGVAQGSGLTQLMRERGMTPAAIDRCFASPGDLTKVTAMTKAAWSAIQGTPSFAIDGKPANGSDWATLEPQLRAAGAR